jgi:hypothetical protein
MPGKACLPKLQNFFPVNDNDEDSPEELLVLLNFIFSHEIFLSSLRFYQG